MRYILLTILLAACSDDAPRSELDAAPDIAVVDQQPDREQPDAAVDQGELLDTPPDLVEDLAPDLAQDMTPDVAPDMACECSSGPCCDGCMFKDEMARCSNDYVKARCTSRIAGERTRYNRYCSSMSSTCEGRLEELETLPFDCAPNDCLAAEGARVRYCQQ